MRLCKCVKQGFSQEDIDWLWLAFNGRTLVAVCINNNGYFMDAFTHARAHFDNSYDLGTCPVCSGTASKLM